MFSRIKLKNEFNKNVLTLLTGTAIAQAISIGVMPILTRIYTPSDFGVFAVYTSLVTILSVVASGRYEMAILQTETIEDADKLVMGVGCLCLIFSLAIFMIISISYRWLSDAFIAQTGVEAYWLFLIPLSVFLTSLYQALQYWLNKRKEYQEMTENKVTMAVSTAVSNITLGVFLNIASYGLIFGYMIGKVVAMLYLIKKFLPNIKKTKIKEFIPLFAKYKNYPINDMPAGVMNTVAQQGSNLMLAPLFGAASAGHFFLIQRIFMMPISLLSSSVASVFRQEATDRYREEGSFEKIFISTLFKLIAVSIPILLVVTFFADDMFVLVFGQQWAVAGEYAKVLIILFVLKFIVSPLTFSFYVRGRLGMNMIGQFLYLLATLSAVFIGYFLESFSIFVYFFTILGSLVYLFYLFFSWRLSK